MQRTTCQNCQAEIELDDDVIECTGCGLVAKVLSRNPIELQVIDEAPSKVLLPPAESAGIASVPPLAVGVQIHEENLTGRDYEMRAALETYLEPDEQLKNWAYGIERSVLLILALFLAMILAVFLSWGLVGSTPLLGSLVAFLILFGILALAGPLVQKDYVVGLSDRRFMVLRVKTPVLKVNFSAKVAFRSYNLDSLPPVKVSMGGLRTTIEILDSKEPFNAQFVRLGMSNNHSRSAEIATALSEKKGLAAR